MSRKNEFAASSPEILTNLQKQARLSAASLKHSEGYNFTHYLPLASLLNASTGPCVRLRGCFGRVSPDPLEKPVDHRCGSVPLLRYFQSQYQSRVLFHTTSSCPAAFDFSKQ
jgi:hypothetical protein